MNLAVSSLLIFVLLSPAILARRIFFTKELSKSFSARNTVQEIFSSIFLSGLLHTVGIWAFRRCGYNIDVEMVMKLMFDPQSISSYSSITSHQTDIAIYFFTLSLASALLSYLLRNTIRTLQWDRKWEFLRFDNTWYYLFSGEAAQIRKYQGLGAVNSKYLLPNQRFVDVLTKTGEKRYLYTGNLVDYQLGTNNTLEFIVISSPFRRALQENEQEQVIKKPITSDYFVIPYIEILNINVRYLYLEELPVNLKIENDRSKSGTTGPTASSLISKTESNKTGQPKPPATQNQKRKGGKK